MVSLIIRSEYLTHIEFDEYSTSFVAFLVGRKLSKVQNTSSNANDISRSVLFALQNNNKQLFLDLYEEISRRKPNKDSEWVFNDILLFAVTLGVCKFKVNKDWVNGVLKLRLEHSQNESLLVAQTFADILSENLVNKNNYQALMLVMKYFLDLPLGNEDYLNSIYTELLLKIFPYSRTPFLNLICLRALDVIILSKGLVDLERQKAVEEFIKIFNSRITLYSTIIWLALLAIVLSLSIGFLVFFINVSPQQAEIINRFLASLPFLGFSGLVIPVIKYKNRLIDFIKKPFFKFYNFKPEKIDSAILTSKIIEEK